MYYIPIIIGCLECTEASIVLGIFTEKEQAEIILKKYQNVIKERKRIQSSFEFTIFEIAGLNKETENVIDSIKNDFLNNY